MSWIVMYLPLVNSLKLAAAAEAADMLGLWCRGCSESSR
jgi:hypothetical protein